MEKASHDLICEALESLNPAGLLAWAILDQKAEKYVTVALASELNKQSRIAVPEYENLDLALSVVEPFAAKAKGSTASALGGGSALILAEAARSESAMSDSHRLIGSDPGDRTQATLIAAARS
jgi:hypothetical protein